MKEYKKPMYSLILFGEKDILTDSQDDETLVPEE